MNVIVDTGASYYPGKPVTPQQIAETVINVIGKRLIINTTSTETIAELANKVKAYLTIPPGATKFDVEIWLMDGETALNPSDMLIQAGINDGANVWAQIIIAF